jgi:hypothetical protein
MNYRSTILDSSNRFKDSQLIATSDAWSTKKAVLVLTKSGVTKPKDVTMIDLRGEFHAYVHIDKRYEINIPALGYKTTIDEGWYNISTVNDAEGEVSQLDQYKILKDMQQEASQRGSIVLTIRYTVPNPTDLSHKQFFTFNFPVDKVESEDYVMKNIVGINYKLIPVKDGDILSDDDTNKIKSYYNNKTPYTWVHCWSGHGRTGQAIADLMTLILKPNSWDILASEALSFNNNVDLAENNSQVMAIYKFWKANKEL